MRTAVFSVISPNYRHYARVLMRSVERHHPEWDRFVLLVGDDGEPASEPFTTMRLEELSLPDQRRFCFRYTMLELNTAVKPWMFESLFARGYDRVLFLDPDVFLYGRLEELDAMPEDTFLTLTPHLTGAIGGEDHPSERSILQAGAYNLGFLSVVRQPDLERFLGWWKEKLEYQCVVAVDRGLFVDQKWLDLAPGLFAGVAILRHDGYNVAYWNLRQRSVTRSADGATVNGQPLRFFHFSGFDPSLRSMVSRHDHALRVQDVGDVAGLLSEYASLLLLNGYPSTAHAGYAYGRFADGTPIPDAARIAYRESHRLHAAAGEDPFAHPELFVGMHDAPRRPPFRSKAALASYRVLSQARPLVRLFPKPLRTKIRETLIGHRDPKAANPGLLAQAARINVVGYVARDTGVGESARLFARSCEAVGIDAHTIDIDRIGGATQHAVHATSIYHVNADQLQAARVRMEKVFDASSYNIGCWHWELPELPDVWIASAQLLDEIWAPSAFVQGAISRKVSIPVVHMPHGVAVTEIAPCPTTQFGVPAGRYTFLCMFDLASVMERKNPAAAIAAFSRAFASRSDAALLIKVGRADSHPKEFAELSALARSVPNVHLTDRALSRAHANGLIASADAVLSLHRSEGFGLVLAEAMSLGKPVVATGWSGNADFMDGGNSCPVAYDLVPLERSYSDYAAGQLWAEPDIEHAAQMMRRLVDDPAWRARLGERAAHTIRTRFSPEAAGLRYLQRLSYLATYRS